MTEINRDWERAWAPYLGCGVKPVSKVQSAYVPPLTEPPRELPLGCHSLGTSCGDEAMLFIRLGWTGQFAQVKGTNCKPVSETGQLLGMS